MRTLLFSLLLVVSAPAAWAQTPAAADDAAGQPRAAGEVEERKIADREAQALLLAPLAAGRTAPRDEIAIVRREQATANAESLDRSDDLLWHVLLTAVGALVSALIWKAVN